MRAIVELEESLMAQLETFFKVDLFQLKTAKDHYDQLSVEKAALVEPALAPPNHRYKAEKSLRRAALHYGDQIQILQSSKSAIVRSLDQLFNITAKDIEVINKIYPTTQKRVQVKEGPSEPNQAQLAEETEERQKPMLSLELTSDSMQKLQMSGPPSGMGPQHSQQGQRMEPRKIITSVSFTNELQLNKSQKAWKHGLRKANKVVDDSEAFNTQELFCKVRSILNKLTPQMFQQLMRQVTELTIDTEEQLQGVIDLIFEKAISEPNFCVTYANMCHCLMKLNVTSTDKPGVTVTFRTLLLNRCQKEFEKDKDDNEVFEKKQKELDTSLMDEEKQRLCEELQEAKGQARRRSLGNIKFIGELFKVKMLTENTMHVCIVKLLKNHNEESMECLCRLLSTIGKDLDCEKATPRMDQYFSQMEQIIKERKTSSRIRFMLQDVLDLRRNKYVPRRGEQCPKTIDQIRKDAELEEHREQIKVQQQLMNKKGNRRGGPGGPHPAAGLRTSRTTAWRSGAPDAWECNSRARRQGGGRLKHGWH